MDMALGDYRPMNHNWLLTEPRVGFIAYGMARTILRIFRLMDGRMVIFMALIPRTAD
jgi:hypothetical protein